MSSLRAALMYTLVFALFGCSHDLHYKSPPPNQPSQVLDLSSIQDPVTDIEQPPTEVVLPQNQEKPQETNQVPVREVEPVQKMASPQKRKGDDNRYEINSSVQMWLNRLSVKDRDTFKSSLSRLDKIRPTMERIFKQYDIPKEMVYLCLVESNANPHAVSCSGARGYWQFMPDTAKKYGLQVNRYVDERKNLEKSTHAAAQYLRHLYSIFGDWYLSIAAYNAGEGAVIRLMRNQGVKTYWDINSSMGIKSETIDYVPKFIATVIIANNRDSYGLPYPPSESERNSPEGVETPGYMGTIARSNGSLNDSYVLSNIDFSTDPGPASIRASKDKNRKASRKSTEKGYDSTDDTSEYAAYKVRKGDTLYSLARKYSTSVDEILRANRLSSKKKLAVGKTIVIPDNSSPKNEKVDTKPERTHVIAQGETLKGIAHEYGVSVEEISRANNLKDPGRIKPRATLVIPASQGKKPVKTTQYKVKKGDTLWGISKQFDVSTMDILRWNRKTSTAGIKPGDELTIYHQ